MKKNTKSNKLIKSNNENISTIRKANTRNISTSIKKRFQNTKGKYFSILSNEDIISKNKFKKIQLIMSSILITRIIICKEFQVG